MATTGGIIHELAIGMRTTADAVVASGNARFYAPGTLVAATVYSDTACTSAITQPLTLNSAGQYRYAYALAPVRMICKASDDTTTIFDGNVNILRAEDLYITNSNVNGGVETTLDAWLTSLSTSTSIPYTYATGATARSVQAYLRKDSIQADDYSAVGDDSTDNATFLQTGIDAAVAAGAPFHIPAGTYRISGPLTMTTGQCIIYGDGPGKTIIKNTSTTGNALVWNYSSTDVPSVVANLTVTASTTSSGAAISNTNANNMRFFNVETRLHRTGFSLAGATGQQLMNCRVLSTDGNGSGIGITVGGTATCRDCDVTVATGTACYNTASNYDTFENCAASATTTGISFKTTGTGTKFSNCRSVVATTTGFSLATGTASIVESCQVVGNVTTGITSSQVSSRVSGCMIIGTATTGIVSSGATSRVIDCVVGGATTTAISLTGAAAQAAGCLVTGAATTAFSLGAANVACQLCRAVGATTGFSVGAFASCIVVGNSGSTNTSDLTINASATLLIMHSNDFANITDSASAGGSWAKQQRLAIAYESTASTAVSESYTPSITAGKVLHQFVNTHGAGTLTIEATATTGLLTGEQMIITIANQHAVDTKVVAHNAQYLCKATATTVANINAIAQRTLTLRYYWDGTNWVHTSQAVAL